MLGFTYTMGNDWCCTWDDYRKYNNKADRDAGINQAFKCFCWDEYTWGAELPGGASCSSHNSCASGWCKRGTCHGAEAAVGFGKDDANTEQEAAQEAVAVVRGPSESHSGLAVNAFALLGLSVLAYGAGSYYCRKAKPEGDHTQL
jgi:hypothetical protein